MKHTKIPTSSQLSLRVLLRAVALCLFVGLPLSLAACSGGGGGPVGTGGGGGGGDLNFENPDEQADDRDLNPGDSDTMGPASIAKLTEQFIRVAPGGDPNDAGTADIQ